MLVHNANIFNARTYHLMMTTTNPIKRGLLLALFVLAV
jgi:hypothetical protein